VRTGRHDGERIEIVEGVNAGDVVIVNPGEVADGMPVRIEGRPNSGARAPTSGEGR
jgi:hypothetical protein